MKLKDLDAKLNENVLTFDCPSCKDQNAHKIRVPLSPATDRHGQSWNHGGEFPETLTLQPSVDAGCWHGWITNGEVR